MGRCRSAAYRFNLLGVAGFALALAACSGDDGSQGPAGSNAVVGGTTVNVGSLTQDELKNLSFSLADSKVTGVTIASAPVVRFTVKDSTGRAVVGLETFWSQSSPTALKSYTNLAFAIAKLVPAPVNSGAPSRWVSYIVTTTATPPALTRPSTDNTGVLTGDGNGNYTYTFYRDIAQTATIVANSTDTATNKKADMGDTTYEPNLTHRLTIQLGGNVRGTGSNTPNGVQVVPGVPMQHPINLFYDFIPATGQVVSSSDETRNIVDVSACFQCHGQFTWHGGDALDGSPGSRQDTRYCVVCHTDQRKFGRADATIAGGTATNPTGYTGTTYRMNFEGYEAYPTNPGETWGQSAGLMVRMVHRIHRGEELARTGYNFAGVQFNHVTYPQDRRNCLKCHRGPDGDNFKNVPNRAACGACHDHINFTTGENLLVPAQPHSVQLNDSQCATCHTPQVIVDKHTTNNKTPNNPGVLFGAVNFSYEISSVTVTASTQPVIKFRILNKDTATPIVFNGTTSGTGGNPLSGFTGAPSFVIAYAVAQNGIVPAEYNNLGNGLAASQPQTASIANLTSADPNWAYAPTTSFGSLSAPDASGYYTATITNAARGFPAGSTMRAVGLQGAFTQLAGTNGIAANTARNAISVVKGVTGDTQRRAIIDPTKCGNCHEGLELHGGSRVLGLGSDPTQPVVCVMCHVPNLSSSGRWASLANLSSTEAAKLTADGYDAANPATWPEATQNFKNLVHQIHASAKRTNQFRHVRDRGTSGVFYYNWSHVTFPGILRNCETCHKAGAAGGYDGNLPAGALPTTNITGTLAADRTTVPNANDDVTLPFLATCVGCHDNAQATSHMIANGGVFSVLGSGPGATGSLGVSSLLRSAATVTVEQCVICHGPGKVAAVTEVHARR